MKSGKMNVLVGNNASGKTRYLFDILKQNRKDAITNLIDLRKQGNFSLDVGRTELLEEIFEVDKVGITNSVLYIEDSTFKFSRQMCEILFLLCIERGILVLDEPDVGLSRRESCLFNEVVRQFAGFYDEIWVATYDGGMLTNPLNNVFKVVENGDLLQLVPVKDWEKELSGIV